MKSKWLISVLFVVCISERAYTKDLAFGKKAKISKGEGVRDPGEAVDADPITFARTESFQITLFPWWYVELGKKYKIYKVVTTAVFLPNLDDVDANDIITITIGKKKISRNKLNKGKVRGKVCGTIEPQYWAYGEWKTFDCPGIRGRYVYLTTLNRGVLLVNDLEVYNNKEEGEKEEEEMVDYF